MLLFNKKTFVFTNRQKNVPSLKCHLRNPLLKRESRKWIIQDCLLKRSKNLITQIIGALLFDNGKNMLK